MKLDYDFENDSLLIRNDLKYKSTLNMDNILVDFAKNGGISGIEILDASKFLSEITGEKVSKDRINTIVNHSMSVRKARNTYFVDFGLEFKDHTKINVPFSTPC